jgi:hypothetical protein
MITTASWITNMAELFAFEKHGWLHHHIRYTTRHPFIFFSLASDKASCKENMLLVMFLLDLMSSLFCWLCENGVFKIHPLHESGYFFAFKIAT